MINSYLEEYQKAKGSWNRYSSRQELVRKYSWAIPNDEAINYLVSLSPIIEIGAGAGYWASLIRMMGGEIIALDKDPYKNHWAEGNWTQVDKFTSYYQLRKKAYSNHTLFLCWPPYDDSMAFDCLKKYQGSRLVYIGEGWGGCTADDAFFDLLNNEWEKDISIDIPQWDGMRDYLISYRRK
jgi:hypothetical protein